VQVSSRIVTQVANFRVVQAMERHTMASNVSPWLKSYLVEDDDVALHPQFMSGAIVMNHITFDRMLANQMFKAEAVEFIQLLVLSSVLVTTHVEIPSALVGRPFTELFAHFMALKVIVFGLFHKAGAGDLDNPIDFVHVHPRPGFKIKPGDKAMALSYQLPPNLNTVFKSKWGKAKTKMMKVASLSGGRRAKAGTVRSCLCGLFINHFCRF
jgi:hypothetical protein